MNHVKGVGHRKPPVQSRIKTSLNLSIVEAMQSLAHYWWNHTSFRIKKVYFRHTFDIFSWRALNYAVLIITDYEMHLLGYKIQLLNGFWEKRTTFLKVVNRVLSCVCILELNISMHSLSAHPLSYLRFPVSSAITCWSPPLKHFANLFKWLISYTLQSSSFTCSLNGSKFRRRVPEINTGSYSYR